jgi:hypothetical protein
VSRAREPIAARLEAAMFELAFDLEGNPIEVPSAAVSWRVRKLGLRGRPEVVYGRDGLPLIVPIDATLAELRSAVQLEGRYRLDPVDEQRGRSPGRGPRMSAWRPRPGRPPGAPRSPARPPRTRGKP